MDTNPDPDTLTQGKAARNSVVTVFSLKKWDDDIVFDGYDSGFIIKLKGGRGIVLTSHHVLHVLLGIC